jgi:hypothetical protein
VNTGVEGKFCCRKMFGLVFLTFVIEEMKILLNFLVLALDFAVTFGMVGSCEASSNTKTFIESMHELGRELGTTIREDFLWDSMKAEDVSVMKISSAFSY